jgi:isoleucyl-tRNA synthetase
MPLKELIVFHHDQEYLDDVKSLEEYIAAELNVVNVVYTSDEASMGIKYKATADWPTLGKKIRKDMGKVKAGLPNLTSDDCKGFVLNGKVTCAGVELVTGDLVVTRYVDAAEGNTHDNATDQEVIVILDIQRHADLEAATLLRSLTSRVNKLRKEAGLKPVDKVDIFYEYDAGEPDAIVEALKGNEEVLLKPFGVLPVEKSQLSEGRKVLAVEKRAKGAEELEAEERFVLTLVEKA